MTEPAFTVEAVTWAEQGAELYAIRRAVFVVEQGVPEAMELDEADPVCWHVVARAPTGQAIGTGRLLASGRLGRLAVLPAWRGHGVGQAMLHRLLNLARQQRLTEIVLHAQIQALPFYAKLGFHAESDEFLEAGLLHCRMRRRLPATIGEN